MPIISITSGKYCNEKEIIDALIDKLRYKLISDEDVVGKAAEISEFDEKKIEKALSDKVSVFNKFTHERERSIAYLKLALSRIIREDDLIVNGYCGQLIPKQITHALKVFLISDFPSRIEAAKKDGLSEKDATDYIKSEDARYAFWIKSITGNRDPFDPSLYDIVVPTDKKELGDIVALLLDNLSASVVKPTESSQKAEVDFELAAKVETELAKKGHNVEVLARDGFITLIIHQNVLFLGKLESELKSIAEKVEGVESVETRVGKGYYKNDIYRSYDFEMPQKVLLVDDEQEFVQTLSERLLMRDMGSAVAYDGESALDLINEDEPEVMILDLRMPGIDGIEVLKKVKQSKPEIEVIILTGHGSEKDRKICMDLGAFDYLQKPVKIEKLSETLKEAYDKIKKNQKNNG